MLAPARITVDDVLRDGLACLGNYPQRWQRGAVLLFLAQATVPLCLAWVLVAARVSFSITGGSLLVVQALLALAAATERGRRHRWSLLGCLHRSWRQELKERDLAALGLLVEAAQSANLMLWRLSTIAPLALASLGSLVCIAPRSVASFPLPAGLAIALAGFGALVIAMRTAELAILEFVGQPAARRHL